MSTDIQTACSTVLKGPSHAGPTGVYDRSSTTVEGRDLLEEEDPHPVSPSERSFIMLPPQNQPQSLNIPQSITFGNSSFQLPYSTGTSNQENLFLLTSGSNFIASNSQPSAERKDEKAENSLLDTQGNRRMKSQTEETKNEKLIAEFDSRMDGISTTSAVSGFQDIGQSSTSVSSNNLSQPPQHVLRYQPSGDAMLSAINYSENDVLHEGGFDVPVTSAFNSLEGLLSAGSGTGIQLPDLLDGDVSQEAYIETSSDLQLSPQTFSNNTEGFNVSESTALGTITDNGGLELSLSDECTKPELSNALGMDKPKIKIRPAKASSPSRPGTQPCPTCGKVFSNSSALTKHKLTHSDERKYICQLCAKAFKRQDHLNGHMLTHRNKKPFECDVEGCGKSYCDARSLRRHKENHHTNNSSSVISVAAGTNHIPVIPSIQRLNIAGLQSAFPSNLANNGATSVPKESSSCTSNRVHYTSAPSVPPQLTTSQCYAQEPSTITHILNSVLPTAASQLQFLAFQQQPEHPNSSPQSQEINLPSVEKEDVMTSWQPQTINAHSLMLSQNFGESNVRSVIAQSTLGSKETQQIEVEAVSEDATSEHEHQLVNQSSIEKISGSSPVSETFLESSVGRDSLSYHATSDSAASSSSSRLSSITGSDMVEFGGTSENGIFSKSPISHTMIQNSVPQGSTLLDANSNADSACQGDAEPTQQPVPATTPLLQQLLTPPQTVTSTRVHCEVSAQQGQAVIPQAFLLSQIQQPNRQVLVPQWTHIASRLPENSTFTNFVQDPKPVECSLCQRKFKNIPALNGHMRLHGGYFKKENDLKKAEKRATLLQQPPLQTASMNVRALIEEKIIQRRTTIQAANQYISSDLPLISEGSYTISIPDNPGLEPVAMQNNPQYANVLQALLENAPTSSLSANATEGTPFEDEMDCEHSELPHELHREIIELKQQFRMPRPVSDKMRRHSDSDHFIQSQRPCTSYISSALADLLRKKVIAKRTTRTSSDPEKPVFHHHAESLPTTPTYSQFHSPFGQQHGSHFSYVERNLLFSVVDSKFPLGAQEAMPEDSGDPVDGIHSSFDYEQHSPFSSEQEDFHVKTELPEETDMEKTSATIDLATSLHLEEPDDDVFLSPTNLPTSPIKAKRKHRPEPLYIPPHVNTGGYTSRLRSPRLWDPSNSEAKNLTPPPYTPPPMLSPLRSGSGLFWHINSYSGNLTPKSAPITPSFNIVRKSSSNEESQDDETQSDDTPETDVLPHVNIGPQYQAKLPRFRADRLSAMQKEDKADKIWDPDVLDGIPNEEVDMYLEFACCAAVPGGGRNKEFALHVLQLAGGNLEEAILRLMNPDPLVSIENPLVSYQYSETDKWIPSEIETYHQALIKCDKDFFSISKECKTKDVKQCIQFYYLWKKVCPEEYKRLRLIRRKREQESIYYNLRSKTPIENEQEEGLDHRLEDIEDNMSDLSHMNKALLSLSNGSSQVFALSDSLSKASCNERSNSPAMANKNEGLPEPPPEIFPCKVCGKIFGKVKSRSAHMKSHRQVDSSKKGL